MANDVMAYLPNYNTVTIFHLRDLVANKRRIIKCDDVKYINIPYFAGLSVEDVLEFAENANAGVALEFLPGPRKELEKMPQEYIGNVVYTTIGDPFMNWVNQRIEQRNAKITSVQNLSIQMDPAIAALFRNSTAVSTTKGTSGHLMKESAKVSQL